MKIGLKLTKLDPPKMYPAPSSPLAPYRLVHSRRHSVLRLDANLIAIYPHSFIFVFKIFWRRRALIARRIYFSETTLSPGRELGFEAFFAFDLALFVAARFTGVGLPCIFFFLPLKIVCREFLFRFRNPLLLMASSVGTEVAGGASAGTSTGAISHGLMLDV